MRLTGWKAVDFGRHSIYSNKVNDICLRSSPCRNQINDISHFLNLSNSRIIPKKIFSGATDSTFTIYAVDAKKDYKLDNKFKSNEFINADFTNSSTLVMKISELRYTLLKSISDSKKKFIVFTNDHPVNLDITMQKASNWQQGIIFHSECQIQFSKGSLLKGSLFKIYISEWSETLFLFTNITDLKVDNINRIVDALAKASDIS